MIHHIKGAISFKSPTYVVVETGGIGYQIQISLHTYTQIERLETVKLLIHYYIKDDTHALYGFADQEERKLFGLLISVSGIGPSTAQLVLSSLSPTDVKAAILGRRRGDV
jgi:Holliday junction DNA helicase RuvA